MSINNNLEDYNSSSSISQYNRISLNTIPEESEYSSKNISNSFISPNTARKSNDNIALSSNNPNRQRAIRVSINSTKKNITNNQMEPILEESIEAKNINKNSANNNINNSINNNMNDKVQENIKIKETITDQKIISNNNNKNEFMSNIANQINNNISSENRIGNKKETLQYNYNFDINLNNNVKKIKNNRRITLGISDDNLNDFISNNNEENNYIGTNSNQNNIKESFNINNNSNISSNNNNTNNSVFNNVFPFQYNNPFTNNTNNPFTNNDIFQNNINVNNNSNNINTDINLLNNINKKKSSKYGRVTIGLGDVDFSLNDPFNKIPPPKTNPNINNDNQNSINFILNNQKPKIKKKLNSRITMDLGGLDNIFSTDETQNQANINESKENEAQENPKKKFKLNQQRITMGINLGDFSDNEFLNNNLKNDLNNEDKYKTRIPTIEPKQINIDYSKYEKKYPIPEYDEFLVDNREIKKNIPMSAKKEEMKNNLAEMSKNIKSLTVKKMQPSNSNNIFNLNQIQRANTNLSLIDEILNENSISSISVSKNNLISFIEDENSSLDLSNPDANYTKNIDIKKEINDQIDYLDNKLSERQKVWEKNIRRVAETHQKYENTIRKKQEELENYKIRIKKKQEEINFYNTKRLLTDYNNILTEKKEIIKKRIIKAGLDINEIKHINFNGQNSLLFTVFIRNFAVFKFITSDNIWSIDDVNSTTKIKFFYVYKTELFRNLFSPDTFINKDENNNSIVQKYYNDTIKIIFPKESDIITVRKIAYKYIFASKISVHFVHIMNIINHISLFDTKMTFETKNLKTYLVKFNFKTIFDAIINFSYLLNLENPFTGNSLYSVIISKGDLFSSYDFEEYKKVKLELIWEFFNPKDIMIGYQYFKNLFEIMYYVDFCDMSGVEYDKTYMKDVMMGYIYPSENYARNIKQEMKKMNDIDKRKIKINKVESISRQDDSELVVLSLPPSDDHINV